jgi:PIN domain nuclease of toxin-antitoxin system
VRVLIDTHTFLWAASNRSALSTSALQILTDVGNECLLNIVSPWEITIKFATQKLSLPSLPSPFIALQISNLALELLPINLAHLAPLESMPFHHRDPFDRLLISQSLVENVPILSADSAFDAYAGVTRLW